MAYTIPKAVRTQMQQQAQAAGLPYERILEQKLYDLQGLADVLKAELQQVQSTASTATDPAARTAATAKAKQVASKLAHCQDQISAYQQEQHAKQG